MPPVTATVATAAPAISQQEIAKAQAHLRRMRSSLIRWLEYRKRNDDVASGARASSKPRALAVQIIAQHRAASQLNEQRLADQLHTLLSEVMPEAALPDPAQPGAAVALAQIAITGQLPVAAGAPSPTGAVPAWVWPAVIVGGLLLAVTQAVGSMADVARTQEQYACVQAGGCVDYSTWLLVGGAILMGWLVWTQTGAHAAGKGG